MVKRDQRLVRVAGYTAALVAIAVLCRRIPYLTDNTVLAKASDYLRIFLYLGLFALWGVSVQQRVMQTQVRRCLVAVAVLMTSWLFVRELRWHLVLNADVQRWLWYLYYIPLLLIPLLALLVAMSLGAPESYRLPRRTSLLALLAAALIALVLTNDLHQWMFAFPNREAMRSSLNYSYGPVYYVVTAFDLACALAALLHMLAKCRVPRTKKILWLPLIPFGIAIVYTVLYALRVPFVVNALGDLAVFDCLIFTAFFECCIDCGLIRSNTRYFDLFRAFVGSSAQITDDSYTVRYAARGAEPIPRETMIAAEAAPCILENGKRLHSMPVNGGHMVWIEDISELLKLRRTLEERREELHDRNAFLQLEYEKEKEHRLVMEQNRLYDLLRSRTQPQMDRINRLTEAYGAAEDPAEKRSILARIVVLGSFIKRRKDFVLSVDSAPTLPESKLTSALDESFRSLALCGVHGGYLVRTGRETLPGETLTLAYDFFECVLEAVLDDARFLNVSVGGPVGALRCCVRTDVAGDSAAVLERFPGARLLTEEDGAEYRLPLEGGAAL